MHLKTLQFIGILLIGWVSTAQFKSPELKIEEPLVLLPQNQINYTKFFNKPLKKRILNKTTSEYDEKGNVIKETTIDTPTKTTSTFVYNNGVLIEKNTVVSSDSEEVNRMNQSIISESSRNNETEVAILSDRNETINYKANVDNKNRVTSFITTYESKNNGTSNKSVSNSEVAYENDKVVSIKSKNKVENFFYDKNGLVKKEIVTIYGDSKEVKSEEYQYDANKNLISIHEKRSNSFKDKITYANTVLIDSATYNNKNLLIWHGNKKMFSTFKYDSNGNVIERLQHWQDKEDFKQEYVYENNKIVKSIMTFYTYKDNQLAEKNTSTTTYSYEGEKLMGYNQLESKTSSEMKCIYSYDAENRLKKRSETRMYYNKTNPSKPFTETTETSFSYSTNSLIVNGKYGEYMKYEFY